MLSWDDSGQKEMWTGKRTILRGHILHSPLVIEQAKKKKKTGRANSVQV